MPLRTLLFTMLAMLAFAGNSLLCRIALSRTTIDAAVFTLIRIAAGALVLGLIARWRGIDRPGTGNWVSAIALFVYAAGFSYAYRDLGAATGALLLFGAVQATMIGHGLARGERLQPTQVLGLGLAVAGLVVLLLPGLSAPPVGAAVLMLGAGAAWGAYSLRGRGAGDPTTVTAGNFLRATPLAVALALVPMQLGHGAWTFDATGTACAVASGALTSGIGYAIWYAALPDLGATRAATVQLSVPVLTALGGVLLLGESASLRLAVATATILGGIALVLRRAAR
jgi:drug/metabolite transporter (DMT)-like permease